MNFLLKILFVFLIWFTNQVNAITVLSKVTIPSYEFSFSKTENLKGEIIAKISVSNFAKSSIEGQNLQTIIFNQNKFSSSSYLKDENLYPLDFQKTIYQSQLSVTDNSSVESLYELENRARVRSEHEVSGAGKIIPKTVDEIKHLLKTDAGKSFFWSGKTNGLGGEVKALEIAQSKGGITLEGLLKEKNIELPAWNPSDPNVMKLWEDVSAEYAKQVSGEVRAVIGNQLRPGNIWQTKELPALMSNTNVTKITTIDPETLVETVIFTR